MMLAAFFFYPAVFAVVLARAVTAIASGEVWRYYDGASVATGWATPSFDDSSWKQGRAELGYGDGGEATVIGYGGNAGDKHVTSYFRHTVKAYVNPQRGTIPSTLVIQPCLTVSHGCCSFLLPGLG